MNRICERFVNVSRPLPALGVFALAVDGVDYSVIAKALDIPCSGVKAHVEAAIRDLASRVGMTLPVAKRPLHSMSSYVAATLAAADVDWVATLSATEQVAVLETRAYFRAFENRPYSVEN